MNKNNIKSSADLFLYKAIKDYLVKYRKHSNSLTSKNIDVWQSEMKIVLDNIFQNVKLKENYKKECEFAYAKVTYYKAQYYMSINNRAEANLKFIEYRYFILYIVSSLPAKIWHLAHKIGKQI